MKGSSKVGLLLFVVAVAALGYFFYTDDNAQNFLRDLEALIRQAEKSFISTPKFTGTIDKTNYPVLFENPRWNHMPITFYLDVESGEGIDNFGEDDLNSVRTALQIWSDETDGVLSFVEVSNEESADVVFIWSPDLGSIEKDLIVGGEGGPSKAVNTGLFTLIMKGEVHLVPDDSDCVNKNRAVHEFGHVLGLDHTPDNSDIMFSREVSCDQILTAATIDTVKSFYEIKANPDFVFLNATASVKGISMDMKFSVKNQGILDTEETFVELVVDGEVIESFDIPKLVPSETVTTTLSNVKVPGEFSEMILIIDQENEVEEIFENNNELELKPSS